MPKRSARTPARGAKRSRRKGAFKGKLSYKKRYKSFHARKHAAAKRIQRAVRKRRAIKRKKKVNKVIRRVLTSMNDEKVTMYRQYISPDIVIDGSTLTTNQLDADNTLEDGDYVATDNAVIRRLVRREDRDFFQINAFHGFCGPSYQKDSSIAATHQQNDADGAIEDDDVNMDTGVNLPGAGLPANFEHNRSDIRAYKEVEIPMLPCIPVADFTSPGSVNMYSKAYARFGREGEKVKITNNYMRFDFFPIRNGEIKYVNNKPQSITGDNSNVEFTFAAGGMQEYHEPVSNSFTTGAFNTLVHSATNKAKQFKIIAPRFCKVRIILWERECYHKDPVELEDFLKPKNYMQFEMGDEEYHQHLKFNRGLKNKRDFTEPTDTADKDIVDQLMMKMKGKLVIDKKVNLPMNKKTSLIFNPLKGKVLEYDPVEVNSERNGSTSVTNTETNSDEQVTYNLPTHVNAVRALPDSDVATKAKLTEYVPKNKQYGMFMLFYVQRCSVEYSIFQKFEYDK